MLSTHAPCLHRRYRRRTVTFSTATRQHTSIRHCSHRDCSQRGDFDTKLKTIHLLTVAVQRVMTTCAATTIVSFVAWDDIWRSVMHSEKSRESSTVYDRNVCNMCCVVRTRQLRECFRITRSLHNTPQVAATMKSMMIRHAKTIDVVVCRQGFRLL